MHILFITSTRLGDAILSTGLLDTLLRRYPQADFTIACGPVAAGLFAHMPRRVRTIEMVKQPWDRHWLELWRQCRGMKWDLCVDLRGSIVSYFLRVGTRHVMRGGRRPGRRITHIGNLLGLDPAPLPVVWTSVAERAQAAEMLPDGPRWIALGPTANWDGKIWPAERFVAVFRALHEDDPSLRPVILYGPGQGERARAQAVLDQLPDALDTGGNLSVTQVAALLGRCTLFIGNDSGLMHLAAACGIPTLGLFGRSRASEYAPSGPWARVAMAPGPVGNAPMEGLAVAQVVTTARALLRDRWGRKR
ncbi:glycosyltransferase family 9 protein [Komagataeibacter europaeus]|uniref:glycosyltransferase family 9 protein n=1 Tax=Komagataeibacter europaeus TaxID=33995 RepID=UPI0002FB0D05|nr:glycosyltransferase family 9 protein [Komagataeibacter europaeus]GBQ39333.1 lipopolysaccharide heptosyltransferase [Komagataeibacter europaeus LMG 18890]